VGDVMRFLSVAVLTPFALAACSDLNRLAAVA
jgi:hypothetical protein